MKTLVLCTYRPVYLERKGRPIDRSGLVCDLHVMNMFNETCWVRRRGHVLEVALKGHKEPLDQDSLLCGEGDYMLAEIRSIDIHTVEKCGDQWVQSWANAPLGGLGGTTLNSKP